MNLEFNRIYTLSNLISFVRILLAIPIYYYVSNIIEIEGARYILLSLYILAYITDIADGYFARKFNQISELGKIIDPLADKILVILVVAYLYYYEIIPDFYFFIIILRDIIIFSGGIYVSKKIGKVLPSNNLGKITVLSIGFFIIAVTMGATKNDLAYQILIVLSIILSFASIVFYGYRGIKEIKKANNEII